jgi:hypothetical protein
MKRLLTLCAVMLVCVAACLAQCTTIAGGPIPSSYLAATGECAIGTHSLGASTNHCWTSAGNAAEFGVAVEELVVGDGWGTWNSPPYAETPTPWIGFTMTSTNQVNLASSASVLGMEIEPNAFSTNGIMATFYDASGNVLATVTQHLVGDAGSMLFAAECPSAVIHSVVINASPSAEGFAFAHIRSDSIAHTPVSNVKPSGPAPPVPPGTTRNH